YRRRSRARAGRSAGSLGCQNRGSGCGRSWWIGLAGVRPALEQRDEETVGVVTRRGQEQIVAARRRGAADRLGPGPRRRQRGEIGLGGKKIFGLGLVFLAQQGAGRIDEAPPGADEARRAAQDLALPFAQFGEIGGARPPLGIGVAPPGADAE